MTAVVNISVSTHVAPLPHLHALSPPSLFPLPNHPGVTPLAPKEEEKKKHTINHVRNRIHKLTNPPRNHIILQTPRTELLAHFLVLSSSRHKPTHTSHLFLPKTAQNNQKTKKPKKKKPIKMPHLFAETGANQQQYSTRVETNASSFGQKTYL